MIKTISLLLILFVAKYNIAQTTTYEYDKLYRLTKVTYSNSSTITYQYDANGNRISELHSPGIALPVTVTDFVVEKQNCDGIMLKWETVQESNNAGFDIEQSKNGTAFTKIGFVAGAGTSNQQLKYQYMMKLDEEGTYFFRLKQVDIDGKYSYSRIIQFRKDCSSALIRLLPNPAQAQITIQGLDQGLSHTFEVFSGNGALVKQLISTREKTIDIKELPQGLYIILVDKKTSLKFIKQ